MDLQQQRILDHLVDYWWEQFNLVPAADIAEVFNIPEAEALTVLEEMARAGVAELHRRQVAGLVARPPALGRVEREVLELHNRFAVARFGNRLLDELEAVVGEHLHRALDQEKSAIRRHRASLR